MELVSPLAAAFQPRRPAEPIDLRGAPVGLFDSMLNESAGWGRALLDGAGRAILEWGGVPAVERRKPMGGDEVDPWADAVAARFRAAVIAVGD